MHAHPTASENVLYVLNLLVSALVLLGIVSLVASAGQGEATASTLTIILVYVAFIVAYVFIAKGLLVGRLRGNGIRITDAQFPEVYQVYRELLQKLGFRAEPRLYCVQSGGVLNAFATRMMFRNYVVVYSEILEAAYEEGRDAVTFVLAHELAHIKRGHLVKNFFIYPAFLLLPLRLAYSRACEYTCDSIGMECASRKGLEGLLILAAGRALGPRVNVPEYLARAGEEKGFWVWFAEFMSTHPNIPKRVRRHSS